MNKFINQAEGIIKEVCGREAVKELKILLDDCKKAGLSRNLRHGAKPVGVCNQVYFERESRV